MCFHCYSIENKKKSVSWKRMSYYFNASLLYLNANIMA